MPVRERGEVRRGRAGGHVVRDDLDPGAGDRGVELLRGALVGGEMPDPAGHHLGGPGRPVPADRDIGQVDVLAMAELTAQGNDLRQDRGEFRGHRRGVARGAVRVVRPGVRVIRGHGDTSVSAPMSAWKPATSASVTAASACRSTSRTAAATACAAASPLGVSEMRNERRSAGSTSRTTYPRRASRSSALVSVVGLVAVAVASAPTVRRPPPARLASRLMSGGARSSSASRAPSACRVAWVARCRARITLIEPVSYTTISDYTTSY